MFSEAFPVLFEIRKFGDDFPIFRIIFYDFFCSFKTAFQIRALEQFSMAGDVVVICCYLICSQDLQLVRTVRIRQERPLLSELILLLVCRNVFLISVSESLKLLLKEISES